jgi:hypothetical protein
MQYVSILFLLRLTDSITYPMKRAHLVTKSSAKTTGYRTNTHTTNIWEQSFAHPVKEEIETEISLGLE